MRAQRSRSFFFLRESQEPSIDIYKSDGLVHVYFIDMCNCNSNGTIYISGSIAITQG